MTFKNDYLEQAIWGMENKFPEHSVRLWLINCKKLSCYTIIIFLTTICICFPSQMVFGLFLLLNILYIAMQLFKLLLVLTGIMVNQKDILVPPLDLPIYTLLLPIYKEKNIIKELIAAIKQIDYPIDKLDVKLIVEEDDFQSLHEVNKVELPKYFELIKVPVSLPRTKPKACNYGLQFAKGKYITIYDAEDRPHPQQLKQIVAKFAQCKPDIICIQARLNYYNRQENGLTKLFAMEYALLFDYMLAGLSKLKLPIPLGGTSNHFIRAKLNELGGWDSFNVTEDADLGMRLHKQSYRTALLNNTTLEEAPISIKAWLKQRSRWIKGHILTSMVHFKESDFSKREKIAMHLLLSIPNLVYLFLPVYLLLSYLVQEYAVARIFWQVNLALSIILPIFYCMLIMFVKRWYDLAMIILIAPFYYLLFPIAGVKAFWQLYRRPFYWDKTEHGVSKYRYRNN